jgi:Raf kinase inhibitor-like YbhB/YbcL family protein
MKLSSNSFKDGEAIPGEFAFCVMDPVSHTTLSDNKNPHLAWSGVPAGTRSLALICHDMDVPSRGDEVNQESKQVPADLPRLDFFHWTVVDLKPGVSEIVAGQYSSKVTARGKPGPDISSGSGERHGLNDYTGWFAGDKDMAGEYFGYDGPCPPWNDSLVHRYVFTLYALDIERVPVDGKFTGQQVRDAMRGHILDQAQITGLYTLNPAMVTPDYGSAG